MSRAVPTLHGPRLQSQKSPATSAVILLHGIGANGDDLIGLGAAWTDLLPETLFIAPHAPTAYPPPFENYHEWFPLTVRDAAEYWRGVTMAGPILAHFIDTVLEETGLEPSRLALVGFSQGTMMALHVGLRRPDPLACIIGYSGRLAGPERVAADIRSRPPVLLVHGADDSVIPVSAMEEACRSLCAAGVTVETHSRPGLDHGIDDTGLALGAALLVRAFGADRVA